MSPMHFLYIIFFIHLNSLVKIYEAITSGFKTYCVRCLVKREVELRTLTRKISYVTHKHETWIEVLLYVVNFFLMCGFEQIKAKNMFAINTSYENPVL